jgi:hypothetical protein
VGHGAMIGQYRVIIQPEAEKGIIALKLVILD